MENTDLIRPFSCTYSPNVAELLNRLNCSLAISTYQAGKVIFISPKDDEHLIQLPRTFDYLYIHMSTAKVYWLTGLSGAGKTAVATAVLKKLKKESPNFILLDGDILRTGLCKDLSFTLEDRKENIRRVAEVSKLFINSNTSCLCTFISPTFEIREMAKEIIGPAFFNEIYINTPLDVCEKRDPKGLYKEVRRGNIKNFTGIDSVYESPKNPAYILNCFEKTLEESTQEIFNFICSKG